MTKNIFIIGVATLAMGLAACGKDKKEGGDKGGDKAAAGDTKSKDAPKAGDGPAIDCAAFAAKMNECKDPFAEAYSKTEFGSKAGKNLDGTVDHEAAAKRFKMLWDLEGEKLCAGGGSGMDTPFVKRDPKWKERFNSCDSSAACDAWVPCMSKAMGETL